MSAQNGGSDIMGMSSMTGDVWDDSELIRAYDKAVKSWRRSQSEKEKVGTEATAGPGPWREVSKEKDQQLTVKVAAPSTQQGLLSPGMLEIGSWIVGAPCRSLYSQDGVEYEAKIVGMEGPQCTVRFVGYGNEELVHLTDLKTTHGKKSRDKQRRDAQMHNNQTNPSANMSVDVDCQSNISLTSSMYNNYTDSVCRDRDVEETFTDSVVPTPLQSSTPQNAVRRPARERNIMRNQVFASYKLRTANFPGQAESADNVDSAIPSAAEATIDSSSERSSQAEGEEPQEGAGNGTNGQWEGFNNNAMPQLKFPVPPMPLSLSNSNGSFDFGRGEIPALLMSWYMAGYQAGCFDAKREIATSANGSGSRVPKSTKSMN